MQEPLFFHPDYYSLMPDFPLRKETTFFSTDLLLINLRLRGTENSWLKTTFFFKLLIIPRARARCKKKCFGTNCRHIMSCVIHSDPTCHNTNLCTYPGTTSRYPTAPITDVLPFDLRFLYLLNELSMDPLTPFSYVL